MARKKISQLESAVDVTASDLIQIVDVEDGGMSPSGTNKKATAQLLANELGKLTNVTATGSTTARSLANRFADVVNVKDFGAVGNGVADDTVAIQAALDYAASKKGCKVVIGSGMRCLVNSNNLYVPPNTSLEGPSIRGGTALTGTDYGNVNGAIILNPLYTIMIGDLRTQSFNGRSGVSNLYIINKNIAISRPSNFNYDVAVSLVDSFDGTAVTIGDHRYFVNSAPSTASLTAVWAFNGTTNVNLISTPITGTNNNITFLNLVVAAINSGTGSHGFTASSSAQFITIRKSGVNGLQSATFITSGSGLQFGVFLADDAYVGSCHIVGFNYAIHASGAGRYEIDKITGDNNNGIYHNDVHDVGRMTNCHFWNYVTTGAVSTGAVTYTLADTFRRKGTAYVFDCGGDDWSEAVNCFSFGYDVGFYVAAAAVRLIGCQSDAYGLAIPNGTKGFHITSISGASQSGLDNHLIGCQSASHAAGFYIDSDYETNLISCSGWSTAQNHAYINGGYVRMQNCVFWDQTTDSAIEVGDNVKVASISGCHFRGVGKVYNINSSTTYKVNIAPDNIVEGFNVGLDGSTHKTIWDTAANNHSYYSFGNANGPYIRHYYATGNTSTPTAVSNALTLGGIRFYGHDGTSFLNTGVFRCNVDGVVSTGIVPTNFIFTTFDSSGVGADRIVLRGNGNLTPATDNAISLGQSGLRWSSVWSANGTIQTSDERTKTDIEDSALGLDFIGSLHPVSYKFKVGGNKVIRQVYRDSEGNEVDANADDASPAEIITEEIEGQRTHFGLIAQEVKAALPEGTDFGGWILTDKDDQNSEQGLRYEQFIAPLIKAVQELKARVEELENA